MKNLFIFLGGGLVGAGITYIGMSAKFNKYEERINAELANISTTSESEEENTDKPLTDEDIIISEEEAEKIQKEEYNKITEEYNNEAIAEEPYVIDIGEAGEFDNYEVVELTYYEDNVLSYDDGTIVEDIEYLVTRILYLAKRQPPDSLPISPKCGGVCCISLPAVVQLEKTWRRSSW